MSQTPAETNRVKLRTKKEFSTSPPHARLVPLHHVSFDGPLCHFTGRNVHLFCPQICSTVPETKGPLEKQPYVAADAFFMMFRRSCQQKEPAWLQRRLFSCRVSNRRHLGYRRRWDVTGRVLVCQQTTFRCFTTDVVSRGRPFIG